ncbi:Arylsulfatase [Hartmannibacter diazotrophicus]|uniref:Arylsulfatase n=1 Tax=Hartmannibacter diazotrophicus TaxID=1482074 RepID=A0A2C9D980_9HYPH|nr:alkaline phosphatase family protein [Hartmannibacter diazotrophicus]SON56826.1 Arylsulfatase [Hartmannibacter diazotrophicus]
MKPNILLITADQWRGDSLGLAGHPVVRTPAIDRLASEGVAFLRHYAGTAPCSPARAVLYTGLFQMNNRVCRNGTPLDDRFDNIARMARRAGYDPTLFGYTDVSPDPRVHDPDDPLLTTYEGILPGFTVRLKLPEHEGPYLSWLRGRGHDVADTCAAHRAVDPAEVSSAPPVYSRGETPTAFVAGEFIRWLSEQEEDRPWFAHVSFIRPHPPFIAPEPYNTLYDPASGPAFAARPSVAEERGLHPFVDWQIDRCQKAHFIAGASGMAADWSEEQRRIIRAIYWGMISEVDDQFARMRQAMEVAGAWDNTLVIFTSDHGELMGDHHLFGKGGFFDGSYHIPLVIRMPGHDGARGAKVEEFTGAVDIMATLSDILGVAPKTSADGHSLKPFLDGTGPEKWRDAAFWEFDFRDIPHQKAEEHFSLSSRQCNGSVLRSDAFKYVHFAGLPPLLFDLRSDPAETTNVAADPAYRDVRLEMAEKLLAIRAEHLDQTLALTELTESGPMSRRS